MSVDSDYTRWAERYDTDRNLTRDLDLDVTARVLGGLRVDVVIEAGCGTGKNTGRFADIGGRVLSIDFSAGMLARAVRRAKGLRVGFCQADLTRPWPCGGEVADLVSFNLVLEHVESLDGVLREAARALRPGGYLFVSELHPYRQYQGSRARFVEEDGTSTRIDAFVHHASEFVQAAVTAGCRLERFDEWWHEEDDGKPPRLLTLLFRKDA
jgi:malonyl-CoA O-methyltransferase